MLIGCGSCEDEEWECWLGDENLLRYLIREFAVFYRGGVLYLR